ncbi:MAG: hypothetical protein HFH53_07690 [Hespellia sp.]|nr:hypothetical protein [Hespellia sp.]
MYEGSPADLKMEKVISIDAVFDEEIHCCKIYKYDENEDYIQLLLEEENLAAISLDAKYECTIGTKAELLSCSGTVKERYQCKAGNMLVFKIENGFYGVPADLKK